MSEFDKKISALTSGSDSQAADEYVIARGGSNYKITGANIAAAATKLGTIATGVWQGTAIANTYIATGLDVTKLTTGATLPSNVLASSLTSVGTLSSLTVSGDLTVDTSTLKVDSANNRVGIGTASPTAGASLDIYDAANNQQLFLRNGGTYHTGFIGTSSATPLSDGKAWGMFGGPNSYLTGIADAVTIALGTNVPNLLVTRHNNLNSGPTATLLNLTSSGNLGLGVTPTVKLDVLSSGGNGFRLTNGTNNLYLNCTTSADIYVPSNIPLKFWTNDTERARITSGGEFMVGTSSTVSSGIMSVTASGEIDLAGFWNQSGAGNGTALYVKRTNTGNLAYFVYSASNTYVGQISTNGTTVSYTSASDERLKENIVNAPDAASLIDAMQVRSFDWKADQSHQRYGMIAQELLDVAPEAVSVSNDPEKMMGVDYSKLVPMLVKEIQSLRARVAVLEA